MPPIRNQAQGSDIFEKPNDAWKDAEKNDKDALDLKEQGNTYFRSNNFAKAIEFYGKR